MNIPGFTKKRLTLEGITATFSQVIADLEALVTQNTEEVSVNEAQIEALKGENEELSTELLQAQTVKQNIANLLKTP